ncbi:hypothetical protein T492DRAFT_1047964 [Pavlovales sp. CCMP2436]|nr:hypothetical protein T492DRAFT_1047964 [Pavlovales sp. CCMP2436]
MADDAVPRSPVPAHSLRPAEAFQLVREVTNSLLCAQHANRLLALENQQLRAQLRDGGRGGARERLASLALSDSGAVLAFDLPPARSRESSVVLSDSGVVLALDLPPARSHASDGHSSRGTQTEVDRPADDHAAVYRIGLECERELDVLRASVAHQPLAHLVADFVGIAIQNAQQHQKIQELRLVCAEHSALLDALLPSQG